MSAIFDFSSLILVILLLICTATYLRELRPTIFDGGKVRVLTNVPSRVMVSYIRLLLAFDFIDL
jgi:hypothetical protein